MPGYSGAAVQRCGRARSPMIVRGFADGRRPVAGTLELTRSGFGIELRRGTFEIDLDGAVIGTIERGDTFEAPLEPGPHVLRVRAGRYSSRSLRFECTDGQVVALRCHGAMVWPRYVASIVKPDLAISLHDG